MCITVLHITVNSTLSTVATRLQLMDYVQYSTTVVRRSRITVRGTAALVPMIHALR